MQLALGLRQQPRQEGVADLLLDGVVKVPGLVQVREDVLDDRVEEPPGERGRGDLLPDLALPLEPLLLLVDPPLLLLLLPLLAGLHPLRRDELGVPDLLKVLLVLPHGLELLLLQDLHEPLLKRLADQDLKNRLDLQVKVKDLAALDLGLGVHTRLHRDEPRGGWPVQEGVRLRGDLRLGNRVRELLQVSVGLDVHVPSAVDGLRRRGALQGLNDLLGPPRRLHQGLRRQNLGGVGVSPHHPAVEHDIRSHLPGLVALAVLGPPARAHGLRLRGVSIRLRRDDHGVKLRKASACLCVCVCTCV